MGSLVAARTERQGGTHAPANRNAGEGPTGVADHVREHARSVTAESRADWQREARPMPEGRIPPRDPVAKPVHVLRGRASGARRPTWVPLYPMARRPCARRSARARKEQCCRSGRCVRRRPRLDSLEALSTPVPSSRLRWTSNCPTSHLTTTPQGHPAKERGSRPAGPPDHLCRAARVGVKGRGSAEAAWLSSFIKANNVAADSAARLSQHLTSLHDEWRNLRSP